MDIQAVKQTLRGPMIPVITHLNNDLSIDAEGIKAEVAYLVEHSIVQGQGVLLAVGAGGDFNMLSVEERKMAVEKFPVIHPVKMITGEDQQSAGGPEDADGGDGLLAGRAARHLALRQPAA